VESQAQSLARWFVVLPVALLAPRSAKLSMRTFSTISYAWTANSVLAKKSEEVLEPIFYEA
jgi:hypothetical protein